MTKDLDAVAAAIEAELLPLRLFWSTVRIIGGYTPRQADVVDAAYFVDSLGEKLKTQFLEELAFFHQTLDRYGTRAAQGQLLVPDGVADPDLITRSLEAMAARGPWYCWHRFAGPLSQEVEEYGRHDDFELDIGLEEAVNRVCELDGTVDRSIFSGKWVPGRRSSEPWIYTYLGFGYGVHINSWPYRDLDYYDRLEKHGAVNSQTAKWQELRSQFKLQRIDVEVEYWGPDHVLQQYGIVHQTPRTVIVKIIREHVDVDRGVDPHEYWDQIATEVYDEVYDIITTEYRNVR